MMIKTVRCLVSVFYDHFVKNCTKDKVIIPDADFCFLFIEMQIKAMPRFLYLPLVAMVFYFNLSSLFTDLKLFSSLKGNLQVIKIENWKNSKFLIFRDFMYFWEGLTAFAFYSKVQIINNPEEKYEQ